MNRTDDFTFAPTISSASTHTGVEAGSRACTIIFPDPPDREEYRRSRENDALLIRENWPADYHAEKMDLPSGMRTMILRENGPVCADHERAAPARIPLRSSIGLYAQPGLYAPQSAKRIDPFEQVRIRNADTISVSQADYVSYDYLHGCVILHAQKASRQDPARSLHTWLNLRCMQGGSSLAGRREAAASLLGARKHLPVLVCANPLEIWIPCPDEGGETSCYLNFSRIACIEPVGKAQKNRCRICFADGLSLERTGRRQIERILIYAKRLEAMLQSSQSSQ